MGKFTTETRPSPPILPDNLASWFPLVNVELRCNIWGELSKAHTDHSIMFAIHMFIQSNIICCKLNINSMMTLNITVDFSTEALKREY